MAKGSWKKSPLLKRLVFVGGLVIIILTIPAGFYFYRQYKESQVETEGLVVCNKQGICERSLHIHAELDVKICSEEIKLGKEEGGLADIHTHKEPNLLHFHERLKATREGEILDYSPLTLANAVNSLLKLKLTNECIGTDCNGSLCPNGKRGKLRLTVNGQEQEEIANYVWQDDDKMELTFE